MKTGIRFYALRHGESEANEAGVISSGADARIEHCLTDKGIAQVELAAKAFLEILCSDDCDSCYVVASPLLRAQHTADVFCDGISSSSKVRLIRSKEENLRERYFGDLDGTSNSNYEKVWKCDSASATHCEYGVESVCSVFRRASGVVRDMQRRCADADNAIVVLIAHGDTLQILQTYFDFVDPRDHRKLPHLETATLRALSFTRPPRVSPPEKWITRLSEAQIAELDPDVKVEVESSPSASSWESQTVESLRKQCFDGLNTLSKHPKAVEYASKVRSVVKGECISSDGHPIALRIFRPCDVPDTQVLPLLVFFHGGGHCIGGPVECFDYACQRLCAQIGCVVVSVDYRLAPEFPFPTGVDDCWHSFKHAVSNASKWGADAQRVCVAGDSAGGNLSAVISLLARDAGIALKLQVLLCPVVDWERVDTESYAEMGAAVFACDAAHLAWYRKRYLRDRQSRRDVRASPIFSSKLSEVANCIIINAYYDPLRSEGEGYAVRIATENASLLRCTTYKGVMHDFYLRFH